MENITSSTDKFTVTSTTLVPSTGNVASSVHERFTTPSTNNSTSLMTTRSSSGSSTSSLPEPHLSGMDTVYIWIVSVTSLLSVSGCLVIIVMHVRFRELRTAGRSTLVQLSVADLLTAAGNVMGVCWFLFRGWNLRSQAYCEAHSSLTIFSSIASFFWTTATALSLYWVLVRHTHSAVHTHWKPTWLLCWGVPAAVTTAALGSRVLGYDPELTQASWCWVDPSIPHRVLWNLATGKGWELAAYLLTVVLYTAVRVSLLRHKELNDSVLRQQSRRDGVGDAIIKLTFVPLVFLLLRLWGTLRFLLGLADLSVTNSPYAAWITPLQGFGDTAQGFCNFVMDVIFSPSVRRRLFFKCPPRGSASVHELSNDRAANGVALVSVRPDVHVMPCVTCIAANPPKSK